MGKKKPDHATDLAGRMLQVLESQRSFGGDAYPPTLQHLGELCDGAPSPDLILKAATKKAFTDRAFVEKVGKKASLNSKVYVKGEQPNPDVLLSQRMAAELDSQRRQGEDTYPPTLLRLAASCGFQGADSALRKAAATAPLADRTTVVARKGKALVLDAPVVFKEDIVGDLGKSLPGLLRYALSTVEKKAKKGTIETAAFTAKELAKRVMPELQQRLEQAVRERIGRLSLPHGVGWVAFKGEPLFFLTENIRPAAPRPTDQPDGDVSIARRHEPQASTSHGDAFPPGDFAQAFRAAFEILDQRNGTTNFVKLADLREALANFSRDEFDAGLRKLRLDGVFSLDSHEGLHGSLSHEEREAGVREAGSLLVYASRR